MWTETCPNIIFHIKSSSYTGSCFSVYLLTGLWAPALLLPDRVLPRSLRYHPTLWKSLWVGNGGVGGQRSGVPDLPPVCSGHEGGVWPFSLWTSRYNASCSGSARASIQSLTTPSISAPWSPPLDGERGSCMAHITMDYQSGCLMNWAPVISLEGLVDLTLRIYARLADWRASRRLRDPERFWEGSRTHGQATSRALETPEMEPMQIGRTKLSIHGRATTASQCACTVEEPGIFCQPVRLKDNAHQWVRGSSRALLTTLPLPPPSLPCWRESRREGPSSRFLSFLIPGPMPASSVLPSSDAWAFPLEEVHWATTPVKILISCNHQEEMVLLVMKSPCVPPVLGRPWLRKHNPQVDWSWGLITGWSPECHTSCLQSGAGPLPLPQLNTTTPPDLSSVSVEYHNLGEVFNKSRATSLPPHRSYDCAINLIPGTSPPRGRLFSFSAPERFAMEKYIGESLAAGLIHPSSSPTGAGFFFVGKKDGSLCPCIDYRGLNEITVKNRYPIPLIFSAFATLQKARYFTKWDLQNAYHLVRIREGDEWKTAFNTPRGHYEYCVMPFGLTKPWSMTPSVTSLIGTSLSTWMTFLSSQNPWKNTSPMSASFLRECQCSPKQRVSPVHRPIPRFCGVQREAGDGPGEDWGCGVMATTHQQERIPQEQRFLGFANFYCRFILGFSPTVQPLTALTSTKVPFLLAPEAKATFAALKTRFSTAPILIMPNPEEQFILEVDASDTGVGAVLSQWAPGGKVHPCA